MTRFSIVLPVYSELEPKQEGSSGQIHFRGKSVQRAIKSIINQQFPDWELIIVDDGCAEDITPRVLEGFANMDKRIKVFHKVNENRAIARNYGMDKASGEWICWMDSDDEYSTHYLRELDKAIKDFPEYKVFNFGSMVHYPDHHTVLRAVFQPEESVMGHKWFRAGHIACGSFIFKRSLWKSKKTYRIPDVVNPYQFAADSKFPLKLDPVADQFQYDNTENPKGAFQDGVYRHGLSLGNPWGDDFLQFYLLTRDNKSKPLDVYLYIIYPRGVEDTAYEHYGEVFDATGAS